MLDMQQTDRQTLTEQLNNAAHVWLLRPETVTDPVRLATSSELLSPDETTRYRRYRFADDRHLYLVAHAMLRRVLSTYVDVDPSDWRFSPNQHGRPEIAAPGIPQPLRFNLSHTRGLVVCLVTQGADCGVDAEEISVHRHATGIAEKMFADTEQQVLQQLDGQVFLERFFTYWTLREAWCKACGIGLANSGKHFSFEVSDEGGWEIRFGNRQDNPAHWQFSVHRPLDTHVIALAIHKGDSQDWNISYRDFDF
jgi:4'-phosphopantetheinyl transferase